MTTNMPSATWRIDSQSPRTRATTTGGVEDGYDIAFVTGEGHPGTVFVPLNRYTPARVQALVQEAANNADAIGSLTHATEV